MTQTLFWTIFSLFTLRLFRSKMCIFAEFCSEMPFWKQLINMMHMFLFQVWSLWLGPIFYVFTSSFYHNLKTCTVVVWCSLCFRTKLLCSIQLLIVSSNWSIRHCCSRSAASTIAARNRGTPVFCISCVSWYESPALTWLGIMHTFNCCSSFIHQVMNEE